MKTPNRDWNDHNCTCLNEQRPTADNGDVGAGRSSWREILVVFGAAATRVHRYRDLHTRMVRDALCAQDCHFDEDRDCMHG